MFWLTFEYCGRFAQQWGLKGCTVSQYCGDFIVFNETNSPIQGLRIHTFPKGGVSLTCNFWLEQ